MVEPVDYYEDPPPQMQRSNSIRSSASLGEARMQEELNSALSMFRDKKRTLDIKLTPQVYIDQNSNPDEVQSWMKAKNFKPQICQIFQGCNGNEMLQLSRDQLIQACKPSDDGKRLFSQLNIQKSHCEVKFHFLSFI